MTARIMEPGQIEPPAGDLPRLRLPARGLFAARARRLDDLARGHGLAPLLGFAARLAACQERLWEETAPTPLPDTAQLAHCRAAAMPPLAPPGWSPGLSSGWDWRQSARRLAAELAPHAPTPAVLTAIAAAGDDWLDAQARALLSGDGGGLDLAAAPIVGAALQVAWTAAAARLDAADIAPALGAAQARCPVCGSPPVASVLRIGGAEAGLRYLHCGLCASEWHVVRAKCALCDNSRGIEYLSLADIDADPAGGDGEAHRNAPRPAVEAECCPECHGYLKLCRQERDPHCDPWADDLATLALDLLVDQAGYERAGLNFLLLQAAADPADGRR